MNSYKRPASVEHATGNNTRYRNHSLADELPCAACMAWHNDYHQAWRIRKGHTTLVKIPVSVLSEVLRGSVTALDDFLAPMTKEAIREYD